MRFSPQELRTLEPSARAQWLALIAAQAQGYQREIASLRQTLGTVLQVEAAANETISAIADEAALTRAVLRLNELTTTTDDAVRAAFTLSTSSAPAIKLPAFRHALRNAELLAQKIEQAARHLKSTPITEQR